MPTVEDLLGGLAAHPPASPRPAGEVRARARRRRRRRRALTGTAIVLAVVAVGVAIGLVATGDDPGQQVFVEGGPTTEAPSTEPSSTAPADADALVLAPATDHDPGSAVRASRPDGAPVVEPGTRVVQCAREAVDAVEGTDAGEPGPSAWCGPSVTTDGGEGTVALTVAATVATPDGVVECKRSVGRCGVAVVGGTPERVLRWVDLDVADAAPAPDEQAVVVDGDEGTVGDGDRLLLTFTGVETGEHLAIRQCRTGVPAGLAVDGDGLQCSGARDLEVVVQTGPETQVEFTAFHDIFVDDDPSADHRPAWVACEPCVLDVAMGTNFEDRLQVPLAMEATEAPIRPEVVLDPSGPQPPGATVTVRATGLQPRDQVEMAICAIPPPEGGGVGCTLADGTVAPLTTVGPDGTLEVTGFRLPDAGADVIGVDCTFTPGTCGVAVDGSTSLTSAVAPIDLSG